MTAMACFASAEGRKVTSVVRTDVRTGKLIRRTVVSPATQQTAEPEASFGSQPIQAIIEESATRNQVEEPLIHSVIRAESGFNPLAVSSKGAQGLMQLIPSTAKRFGVKDSFDSKQNVEGGVKYLRYLIDLFHGDYTQAVAAYNAGEAAVTKYGGVPPFQETRNYVAAVARNLEQERRAFSARPKPVVEASAADASDAAEQYNPITISVGPDGRTIYRTP
jgi:soluble lytic murein transglycosylase-like protein